MENNQPIDWHSLVFDPAFYPLMQKLALKRFVNEGLAEEACTYVIEEISADNWRRLNSFSGKAKPQTFVYTVASHLIEEFSRKRFGRPQPPKWLKDQGELWVAIWKRVCLERQLPQQVVISLTNKESLDGEFLNGIIKTIKGRLPWCGSSQREIPESALCADCDDEPALTEVSDSLSFEQQQDAHSLNETLVVIHELFKFVENPSNQESLFEYENGRFSEQQFTALKESLDFTSEEHLMLKMVFQDGFKYKQVAEALGMPQYQPKRILDRLLKKVKDALNQVGFDDEAVTELLREDG